MSKISVVINTLNEDLVRLTGLKENSAPFALAGRKDSYNQMELEFLEIFGIIDDVINAFNGNSNLTGIVNLLNWDELQDAYYTQTPYWLN